MDYLKPGYRYLIIEEDSDKYLHEILVLEVSEKAYKIRWNNGNSSWVAIRRFTDKWIIYETLGDTNNKS